MPRAHLTRSTWKILCRADEVETFRFLLIYPGNIPSIRTQDSGYLVLCKIYNTETQPSELYKERKHSRRVKSAVIHDLGVFKA